MRKRLISTVGLVALMLPAILLGGIFYYLVIGVFLVGAAREYVQLFNAVKFEPQMYITVGGVFLITFTRMFFPQYALPVFEAAILVALTYHVIAYERGRDLAALDFGLTVTGFTYIGWIGSYLFDLRNLPQGAWWFALVMCCVWLGDSGAYLIGVRYGRHKMAPRLSPKKSWEGYAASVIFGMLTGIVLTYVFTNYGSLVGEIAAALTSYYGSIAGEITILQGALMGLILGALPPLGDLGESMIKRQSGIKDSSDIIPGHGGFFDRVDSWIWGAVIGYYFLIWFIV
jgi:phosphatidate cytidylyltransferase